VDFSAQQSSENTSKRKLGNQVGLSLTVQVEIVALEAAVRNCRIFAHCAVYLWKLLWLQVSLDECAGCIRMCCDWDTLTGCLISAFGLSNDNKW